MSDKIIEKVSSELANGTIGKVLDLNTSDIEQILDMAIYKLVKYGRIKELKEGVVK
jgi:hypothetical protein